jgi:hypothetical protein
MRAFVAIATVLAVLAGCPKKSSKDSTAVAMERMREFKDRMCACKAGDKPCADKVQDELIRWSTETAKTASDPERLDERTMKEMTEIGTQYAECIQIAMSPAGTTRAPDGSTVLIADALIKQTFDDAGAAATVTELRLSYVREDGVIDPTYGTAEIHLGKPKRARPPADDPSRPIGAPVPVDPQLADDVMARCPVYTWKSGARTESDGSCLSLGALERPRCSVLEVWAQAIEAGAPAKGLAIIDLNAAPLGERQSWTFSITDGPRDIHFAKSVPDVCEPTLEKPVPVPPTPGKVEVKPNPY